MAYPPYVPTDWVELETLVNEARMDHIEQGIKYATDAVIDLDSRVGAGGGDGGTLVYEQPSEPDDLSVPDEGVIWIDTDAPDPVPGSGALKYMFEKTAATPVADGEVRLNHLTPDSATAVYISQTTLTGDAAVESFLVSQQIGTQIHLQDKTERTRWAQYKITDYPSPTSTWVEFPVEFWGASAGLLDATAVEVSFIAGSTGAPVIILTQAEYDAIMFHNSDALYVIVG